VNALLVSSLVTFHLKMKVWKITIFISLQKQNYLVVLNSYLGYSHAEKAVVFFYS